MNTSLSEIKWTDSNGNEVLNEVDTYNKPSGIGSNMYPYLNNSEIISLDEYKYFILKPDNIGYISDRRYIQMIYEVRKDNIESYGSRQDLIRLLETCYKGLGSKSAKDSLDILNNSIKISKPDQIPNNIDEIYVNCYILTKDLNGNISLILKSLDEYYLVCENFRYKRSKT